ncbi:AGAP005807-PC-like protein [Anopheles sinensis]|uniref:AGAP005807-PC-like protein n=1 Tax=Anopheles sinensis TaxID=74873 RepID=A0A084WDH0_ANOSI|nr:AGAP005807-PC-like protein [Anopheles sinensis]
MAAMQRRLVHKQFNSPINLYSQKNIQETLDRELKLLSNGATKKKVEKFSHDTTYFVRQTLFIIAGNNLVPFGAENSIARYTPRERPSSDRHGMAQGRSRDEVQFSPLPGYVPRKPDFVRATHPRFAVGLRFFTREKRPP